MDGGGQRHSPAAVRNAGPILEILRSILPLTGLVLEVASGTGEHIASFARALPALAWQPSDPSVEARSSVAAWTAAGELENIRPPLDLDARNLPWPIDNADAIICINMIHISPWQATEGLMRGASAILSRGAPLFLYGPLRRSGIATAPSNEAFDADLRQRDPAWGLRDIAQVASCAVASGLLLERVIEMPANNLSILFRNA